MPISTKHPKFVILFTIPGKSWPILKSAMVLIFLSKENTLAFALGSKPGFSN